MTKPRVPYLHWETNRHGVRVWYFRKRPAARVRIRGEYGSPEFMAAYSAALSGVDPNGAEQKTKYSSESLAWLISRYKESAAWATSAIATQKQRSNIFKHVINNAGSLPFASITKTDISLARDKRAKTPAAATNYLKTMKALYTFAVEAGYVDTNPAEGVKRPKYKTNGYHVWTEEEVAQFEAFWPIGTRERLALAVLLHTGLRRGDAAKLGRQHFRDNLVKIVTGKNGQTAYIPVHPDLRRIIDASPTGDLTLIVGVNGRQMTKESFGNWFKDACKDAGVPGSAHGLRKAGATRAAEQGATESQLEAIFGWTGGKMASHYTKTANREILAREFQNKTNTSMPAPAVPAPAPKIKRK